MYPTICKIGPLTVHSYGLMLAIAVLVSSFLVSRDAKKEGISPELIYDLAFITVLSGIIGARIFYILLNPEYFFAYPLEIIMIQKGGLAWQGGIIAGLSAGVLFLKRKKLSIAVVLDLTAPYIALGQSIGRVGCFLNGCCYGRPVSWGIFFPIHNDHLHPTQLYLTAGYAVLFFILKAMQRKHLPKGFVITFYILLAATLRFNIEFFRGDHHQTLFGLSVYQYVCIGLVLVSLFLFKKLKTNSK